MNTYFAVIVTSIIPHKAGFWFYNAFLKDTGVIA